MFFRATTLVDLGCRAGGKFAWLERAVVASGRIIGVDVSDAMLREARHHVENRANVNVGKWLWRGLRS